MPLLRTSRRRCRLLSVERLQSGAILVSAIVDGFRVKSQYMGYSEQEAKDLFRQEHCVDADLPQIEQAVRAIEASAGDPVSQYGDGWEHSEDRLREAIIDVVTNLRLLWRYQFGCFSGFVGIETTAAMHADAEWNDYERERDASDLLS